MFLFGGCTSGGESLDIVERLDFLQPNLYWSILALPPSVSSLVTPRKSPGVAVTSQTELIILGGTSTPNLVFNVLEGSLHKQGGTLNLDFNSQQMPAMLAPDTLTIITGDLKTKNVIEISTIDSSCKVVKNLERNFER